MCRTANSAMDARKPDAACRNDRGAAACLVVGCSAVGVFLLIIAGLAVLGGVLFQRGASTFRPKIQAYWDAMNAGDLDEAASLAGDTWREAQSPGEIRAFLEEAHERYGRCTDFAIRHVNYNSGLSGSFATITTHADFERGEGQVVFSWVKEAGEWVLSGVEYDVPQAAPPPEESPSQLVQRWQAPAAPTC